MRQLQNYEHWRYIPKNPTNEVHVKQLHKYIQGPKSTRLNSTKKQTEHNNYA